MFVCEFFSAYVPLSVDDIFTFFQVVCKLHPKVGECKVAESDGYVYMYR